jgi:hypothetical protein
VAEVEEGLATPPCLVELQDGNVASCVKNVASVEEAPEPPKLLPGQAKPIHLLEKVECLTPHLHSQSILCWGGGGELLLEGTHARCKVIG